MQQPIQSFHHLKNILKEITFRTITGLVLNKRWPMRPTLIKAITDTIIMRQL